MYLGEFFNLYYFCDISQLKIIIFIPGEKITRIIRKVIEFWEREERTKKEKKFVIGILATVLTVFIFLNMTCLALVLTGYI